MPAAPAPAVDGAVHAPLGPQLVEGRAGGLRGGRPHLLRVVGVHGRHQRVDGCRAAGQDAEQLLLPERAVGQVEVENRAGVLGQLGTVAAVERARAEVVHPPQGLQVGEDVALRVGHDRCPAAQHVIAHEYRTRLQPEGQVVGGVAGRRDDVDARARDSQPLTGREHPAARACHRRVGRGDVDTEVGAPRQRGLCVVAVVVGDEHGHALGVAGGQGGFHGGEVQGVVGPRIDHDGGACARRADDVGVRAVQGHAAGVGREHAGDQRLEGRRTRHLPGSREGPGGPGSAGAVTSGTVAVDLRRRPSGR